MCTKTGLDGKTINGNPVTTDNPEWPIYFCNFHLAWERRKLTNSPSGNTTTKGEGIRIGHPDTGFTDHPELLEGNLLTELGRDFFTFFGIIDSEREARDKLLYYIIFIQHPSHGTALESTIISKEGHPNKNEPNKYPKYVEENYVSGVAPDASLIPYRVTKSVVLNDWTLLETVIGGRSLYRLTKAIKDCIKKNVGVISISLGGFFAHTGKATDCIKEAVDNGIIIIAAAGQFFRKKKPAFPGKSKWTICVSACNHKKTVLESAFIGKEVDVVAPGVDIWNARTKGIRCNVNGNCDDSKNTFYETGIPYQEEYSVAPDGKGTSYATAITAGACAIWLSYWGREWLMSKYVEKIEKGETDEGVKIFEYDYSNTYKLFKFLIECTCDTPDNWKVDENGAGILNVNSLLDVDLKKIDDNGKTIAVKKLINDYFIWRCGVKEKSGQFSSIDNFIDVLTEGRNKLGVIINGPN